ncbi:IS66 family insertion sequence element accessory protein TnpA [Puia sp.]|uniref:IS66 family insertion sequence element accessory protein TnpA n=1 Tax=Puia sp. TaxID=2045100 RepID=UPI002F41E16F
MSKDESVRERMFTSIGSWQASELSQKEWCRQQGIPYHIFHYWYRRYREQNPAPAGDNGFVRLAVTAPADACCEVIFTDGTKIIFREPVAVQYLKSLLF